MAQTGAVGVLKHLRTFRKQGAIRSSRRTIAKREVFSIVLDLGEQLHDPDVAARLRMLLEEELAGLSEFDRAVVRLRREGYAIREIADQMDRSPRTDERVMQGLRDRLSPVVQP